MKCIYSFYALFHLPTSPLGNTFTLPRTHCRLAPHKASELPPDIRKSKTVQLHIYAPR
ncbi:hypothetical protein B0F90DRAFT_1743835, partial [Multifurca ochricompacta]